jgi:hypothetical protein
VTVTAVPLVTAMLPGVTTPVPPVKTAVRLELEPAAIEAGLAAKLVIVGGVLFPPPPLLPPPQPVNVIIASPETTAIAAARRRFCVMASSNEGSLVATQYGCLSKLTFELLTFT